MPISNYSVLKGDPTAGKVVSGSSVHYQITVQGNGGPFTVAVNIQSVDGSEVLYVIDSAFVPPNPGGLLGLASGMTRLQSTPGGLALDFVRETVQGTPMVDKSTMTQLSPKFPAGHRHNTLQNAVVDLLNRTIADRDGTIYAFGSAFADKGRVDGIHDIHMNQGNPIGNHSQDNGIWQDGGLIVNLPSQNAWIAVFIAFQTQIWTTDNNGNPIASATTA
ncbi:MAG TPA: YukJ family protein [Bryobacteraceae bacterium]|jgi:uncharacterized protein YukJ